MAATRPGKLFAAIVIAGASIAGGGGCASATGATDAREDGADVWWAGIRAADVWWTGIRADVPEDHAWWDVIHYANDTPDAWWTGIRPIDLRDGGDADAPAEAGSDAGGDAAADTWWTGIRPVTDG